MGGVIAIAGLFGLVAVRAMYQSWLRNSVQPREMQTSLAPEAVKQAFAAKVAGTGWKVIDDDNPMVAQSSMLAGRRQELSMSMTPTGDGLHVKIWGSRIWSKGWIRVPYKAHTIRMRMNAFERAVKTPNPAGSRVHAVTPHAERSSNVIPSPGAVVAPPTPLPAPIAPAPSSPPAAPPPAPMPPPIAPAPSSPPAAPAPAPMPAPIAPAPSFPPAAPAPAPLPTPATPGTDVVAALSPGAATPTAPRWIGQQTMAAHSHGVDSPPWWAQQTEGSRSTSTGVAQDPAAQPMVPASPHVPAPAIPSSDVPMPTLTGASPLMTVTAGQQAGLEGVTFVYSEVLPDTIRSSTGADGTEQFRWRWLLVGDLVLSGTGKPRESSGGALVGNLGERIHVLALPARGNSAMYQVSGTGTVSAGIDRLTFKAGFARHQDVGVAFRASDQLTVKAFGVSSIDATGAAVDESLESFVRWAQSPDS